MTKRVPPYSPEVRARAVRMVLDHQGEHASQGLAIRLGEAGAVIPFGYAISPVTASRQLDDAGHGHSASEFRNCVLVPAERAPHQRTQTGHLTSPRRAGLASVGAPVR